MRALPASLPGSLFARRRINGLPGRRTRLGTMAEPARRHEAADEAPTYDPGAIQRTLLKQRLRREARLARKRARRNARIRFLLVIFTLLAGAIVLGAFVWQEIQKLFGL
jgi:hypothetical protein